MDTEALQQLKSWKLQLHNVIQHCVFCDSPTRYWYKRRNKPVCTACAKERDPIEIPKVRQKNDSKRSSEGSGSTN